MFQVWSKTQLCKVPLKHMHKSTMDSIDKRIGMSREYLGNIQRQMTNNITDNLVM